MRARCTLPLLVGLGVALSAGADRPGEALAGQSRTPVAAPGTPAPAPGTAAAARQGPIARSDAPRSKRNANYSIDVELDPANRTIVGRETLTWRNVTRTSAAALHFHLYWNAWLNDQSTWMREALLAGGFFARATQRRMRDGWGSIDLTAVRVLGTGSQPFTDLTSSVRFIAPDDGNAQDRTLASVALPRPIAPGESIAVEVAWSARVPRAVARTGHVGRRFFFIAQWFPKIAVLEDDGWNAHQFHASTEFFSDYGVYDVRITVPSGWVVGATGREQQRLESPAGKTTHRYTQEDVHDFAWTTSPDYVERRERFEHRGLPGVDMRLLLQPEHEGQAARYFAATRAALRYYGEWFGPYPYGHVTVVDPAWQSQAGGMEYPTLFTGGTRWLAPRRVTQPEGVTVHEAGHQFWYGLVGNNEFEHAWLDEGLNSFSTARVIEAAFEPNFHSQRFFGGFVPWVFTDIPLTRATDGNGLSNYRPAAESDAPSGPSWRYYPATGAAITYSKTALWLHTLERYIGWPRLRRGLSLFFTRGTFRHPRPSDLFEALEEGAGTDLGWYFDEVHRTSLEVDYGIQQFSSEPLVTRGYRTTRDAEALGSEEQQRPTRYRTELVVRRYGEATLPVEVLVVFADGVRKRQHWDGRDRWKLYTFEGTARAVRAEVDPSRVLLLDLNTTNNSSVLEPRAAAAARKWSLHWMTWLQDSLVTWAALL